MAISMEQQRPATIPANPFFSSGPCKKPPGWSTAALESALVGRSHRSGPGRRKLRDIIDLTREVLVVPDEYRIGIVPASDTGAVEMSLWSLLGQRSVEMLVWDSFGNDWATDVVRHLGIDARVHSADYGHLPDITSVDFDSDVVFAWNGTTSGVCMPDGGLIPHDRGGLTICDATSAAFAMELPWERLDVTTFSWQKVLGSEAAHGMLVLSPRAVERLQSWTPPWPLPKIFRLADNGRLNDGIFSGATINTPSMICVEDVLHSLNWAREIGGLPELVRRSRANASVIEWFVRSRDWIEHLAVVPETRSTTSVCLRICPPGQDEAGCATIAREISDRLGRMGVAYDIGSYRNAPPGLRIWCGATVESSDLEVLMPWLEWAYHAGMEG